MADRAALAIVRKALELTRQHPGRTPLEILDLAMDGHRGSAPDFSTNDPEGDVDGAQRRFGELLRQAFAPRLGAFNGNATVRWQREVLERFAQRYELWRH
jgi:hypothetical protein